MDAFSAILILVVKLMESQSAQDHRTEKKYIQDTRLQNYLASLKLEGITASGNVAQLNKAQILQKYKKYSQAESELGTAMDKYGELGDSLYCYSGTNILKNKLNIRDEQILEQAELELSGIASSLIEYAEPASD